MNIKKIFTWSNCRNFGYTLCLTYLGDNLKFAAQLMYLHTRTHTKYHLYDHTIICKYNPHKYPHTQRVVHHPNVLLAVFFDFSIIFHSLPDHCHL